MIRDPQWSGGNKTTTCAGCGRFGTHSTCETCGDAVCVDCQALAEMRERHSPDIAHLSLVQEIERDAAETARRRTPVVRIDYPFFEELEPELSVIEQGDSTFVARFKQPRGGPLGGHVVFDVIVGTREEAEAILRAFERKGT